MHSFSLTVLGHGRPLNLRCRTLLTTILVRWRGRPNPPELHCQQDGIMTFSPDYKY